MSNEYFGTVSKKGIQLLPFVVPAGVFGALGAEVGTVIDGSQMQGITRGMLVKKVHIMGYLNGLAANQPVIIGLAGNDSGVSGGFGAGAEAAIIDPEATDTYLTQQEIIKTVWHETCTIGCEGPSQGDGKLVIDMWASLGGGKGIPFAAGAGPELIAFNPADSALTTGGEFIGTVLLYGVWLED